MKPSAFSKSLFVEVISYLYILLFVYAAVSKLTDFQNFRLQIAQSPLLTAYAGFAAVTVLAMEFIISLLLAVPKFKLFGMYAAFTLMTMFSIYILIILNYSPYVPCSCGGILEKMGWKEHLAFNAAFVLLAAIAILCLQTTREGRKSAATRLAGLIACSAVLMWGLFITSENIIHNRNNFVRRIPPFAAAKSYEKKLSYNSYYLAGYDRGIIYLGNITTPSIVTMLDTALVFRGTRQIALDDSGIKFTAPKLHIQPPNFFVFDGTVPVVFTGNIKNWKAQPLTKDAQIFTSIAAVDSTRIIFRAATKKYGNLLGSFDTKRDDLVSFKHGLLQKQVDGFFDTDGMMHYSTRSARFVYLYNYRNEYIITDKNLNLISRGNTIDTTTKAKIKTEYLKKTKLRKFSAPPHLVNRQSALYDNLLFVNSMLAGKYDAESMWKYASIIDVYDINEQSYVLSFYVYKVDGRAFDGFVVNDTHLFALFGKTIVAYRLHPFLTTHYDLK